MHAMAPASLDPNYGGLFAPVAEHRVRAVQGVSALGDQLTNQIAQGGSLTAGVLSIIPATAAIPFLGPAVALGAALVALLGQIFSGCGQSCVLTSDAANKVEQALKQNLDQYMAASPRYHSLQAQALQNFDAAWSQLSQFCGQAQFGSAGQRCTQDREAGSCKWKASAGHWDGCTWTPAGPSGSGDACWNWFIGYRDPIANDPCVQPDPAFDSSLTAGASGSFFGIDPATLLLGAGALLLIATGGAKN